MASVKVCIRKRATIDNKHSLFIQIIKDRKKSIITLGHDIPLKDWDEKNHIVKKSHKNSGWLNGLIAKKVSEANDKLLELEKNNTDTSARAISNSVKAVKNGTFNKQAELYLKQLNETGKFNQWSADSPRVERFKEFLDNGDINFAEIDMSLLKKFKAWLKGTRNVSERTIVNHLVVIRTIYNQAMEAGLVDRKYYPFGKGKVKIKFPESVKIGLNADEISALEMVALDELPNHARNLWLFAYYFAGMRISDVLRMRWNDFQNDRLFYQMGKNTKILSLKVPNEASAILGQYKRDKPKHDLVFPDLEALDNLNDSLKVQAYIKTRVKANNKQLQKAFDEAKIKKTAGFHKARHSFGEAAGDAIPIQMLQKLYRHSHISTTIGYQGHFTHKDADDALDAVLNKSKKKSTPEDMPEV